MPSILIIDDDIELCRGLAEYLQTESFEVAMVHDGRSGVSAAVDQHYDAIVLDVMLPEMDGFSVLRALRKQIDTPVIMLTAKGEEIDRIGGLDMGADDYVPKPCTPRELVARIRAILRRTAKPVHGKSNIQVGDLEVQPTARQALYKSEPLPLTSSEYNLLEVLAQHAGNVVDKETLSEKALGKKLTAYDRSIDMHMSKLRNKLGDSSQQLIQTVRGVGYQLTS